MSDFNQTWATIQIVKIVKNGKLLNDIRNSNLALRFANSDKINSDKKINFLNTEIFEN